MAGAQTAPDRERFTPRFSSINLLASAYDRAYSAPPRTDIGVPIRAVVLIRTRMSDTSFECVSCGACCFSKNPKYLALLNWDASRSLPEDSLFREGDTTYVRFECGHCTHLSLGAGLAVCTVYEDRPEACRAFRAGSFECIKARRANGIMGERLHLGAGAC